MSKRAVNWILVGLSLALAAAVIWGRQERVRAARLEGDLTAQTQTLEAYRGARRHLCGELWARTNQAGMAVREMTDPTAMVEARVMMHDAAYFGRHCADLPHAALTSIQYGLGSDANPSKAELEKAISDVLAKFAEAHDLDYPLVEPTVPGDDHAGGPP